MATSAPTNAIARAAVPFEWGTINRQRKIGPGVFGFSCSGHGGIIVVTAAAHKLTSKLDSIIASRSTVIYEGHYYRVPSIPGGPRGGTRRLLPGAEWTPNTYVRRHDVVVLEEDCDWLIAPVAFEADWTTSGGYTTFASNAEAKAKAREHGSYWFPELAA